MNKIKSNDDLKSKVKEILSKPYSRRLLPDEEGGYVASIQEFPGCVAQGDSAEEALKNLDSAAESWIYAALSSEYSFREPISFFGYSGKIALRIPRGLHKQIAELAELEETSVNQLLVTAISSYAAQKDVFLQFKSELSRLLLFNLQAVWNNNILNVNPQLKTSQKVTIESGANTNIYSNIDMAKYLPAQNTARLYNRT